MTKLSPVIMSTIVLGALGALGALYYFKDPILDTVDPDNNRNIGEKYFGGKTSRHKRHKKSKNTRRK